MASGASLVECVPNFSEGRDADVVGQLVDTMTAVAGVVCLAHELDGDHHRCVITLAGPPDALVEALVHGARDACRDIDLRQHRGVHMRMGALDVCPFVPLLATPMSVAVDAALAAGARFARELDLPVFLYGEAAARPERRVLGAVRNLEFERLGELVGRDDDYRPDLGPARLHESAGAVGVGARDLLIAYNIELRTEDVALARRIAKEIRASDGGLPAVQARGFALGSRATAQVSTNLLDYTVTSVCDVFDAVAARAAESGVEVEASELVGLVPEAAFDSGTARHVQLRDFDPRAQLLEERLRAHGLL